MDNKKIRGWMVRILQRAYPAGLEGKSLHKQLYELGYKITRKDFDVNLSYLIEDSFIKEDSFGGDIFSDTLQNKIYKLTTKGIDLAENSITDAGVDL